MVFSLHLYFRSLKLKIKHTKTLTMPTIKNNMAAPEPLKNKKRIKQKESYPIHTDPVALFFRITKSVTTEEILAKIKRKFV